VTISELVHRERRSLHRLHLAAGMATTLAATALVLTVATLVLGHSRWLVLPRALPVLVWVAVIAIFVVGWILARRYLARATDLRAVAAAVEREQSLRPGSVQGTMEVADTGSLGRRAAEDLAQRLRAKNTLAPGARKRAHSHLVNGLSAAAMIIGLLVGLAPGFGDGLNAVMRPVDAWRGRLLPAISFENLPPVVVRGEMLKLHVVAHGRRMITLQRRSTGEGWHSDELTVDAGGTAALDAGPMTGDLFLVASDGRSSTDTTIVRVADRPFLGGIAMRAVYPAYLQREAEQLAMGEPVRVPIGTTLEVTGRASTALDFVRLIHARDSIVLSPNGHTFRGRFMPAVSGSWTWNASGKAGDVTDVPPPIDVEVIPDSVPRVEIITPLRDTLVAPRSKVSLRLAAMDDHGLAAVDIVSWPVTSGKDGSRTTTNVAQRPGAIWGTTVVLDVAERGLDAGDVLHLKLVASDDSPWRQKGESREVLIRVATPEQERGMARDAGDSAVAAADAAVKKQKALERRAQDASQDRASSAEGRNASNMSFDAAQKAKAVAQDQKAMTDQVKKLADAAKALEQQLREAGALDSSLARQLQEAQAMLRDALTPEMMAQLAKLEQSAQQLSREDAQQSLKDLQAQQKRMREQLEKSAEMLRRAAMEGSMQTLSDEAKDLADRQKKLADSVATGSTKQETARELADRTGRLGQEMEKLQERLENAKAQTGAAKTEEAKQHARQSEESLKGSASSGASSGSGTDASRAASQMEQAAASMKAARDGQVQEWKRELTSALDQSIQEMLQMSREENALQQQVKNGQAKPEDARGQQSAIKQGLDEASQRLQREAQKSTLLSGRSQRAVADAQEKVNQATQNASDPRTTGQSSQSMNDAAEALNKAAASLARDRERANTASSATGFAEMIQQMQDMAGKQGSINSQAQGLMPQMGNSANAAAQAQSRALARQQRQIADKLDELGDGAGGDKAAKMAQEARQLADALDGSRIDAQTLARQQQLFKRLLDAGRSLEKDDREESDKREAKSADDPRVFAPRNGEAKGKDATRFREPTWDELRGLSADERRVILEYFRKLNGKG
jgi:hypothetical protein